AECEQQSGAAHTMSSWHRSRIRRGISVAVKNASRGRHVRRITRHRFRACGHRVTQWSAVGDRSVTEHAELHRNRYGGSMRHWRLLLIPLVLAACTREATQPTAPLFAGVGPAVTPGLA